MRRYKDQTGFTLIELLVVISIVAYLASLILAQLHSATIHGRDAKRKADLRQLAVAITAYVGDQGAGPVDDSTMAGSWGATFKSQLAPYVAKPPLDPLANSANRYYGAYYMTWAGISGANCNSHWVVWGFLESTTDPAYGQSTCGFGGNHYFIVIN